VAHCRRPSAFTRLIGSRSENGYPDHSYRGFPQCLQNQRPGQLSPVLLLTNEPWKFIEWRWSWCSIPDMGVGSFYYHHVRNSYGIHDTSYSMNPGSSSGGTWSWSLTFMQYRYSECVELYLHSSLCLHDGVLRHNDHLNASINITIWRPSALEETLENRKTQRNKWPLSNFFGNYRSLRN